MGIVFALAPSVHSFWSYFSTDFQQHIGHLPTWGVSLSVSYHFAFSYCSWGSQGKNTEVVCHSLLQRTTFCQTSPPWPDHLGWPLTAWLSFTELDKAVVLWSDWLAFCDYGFSASALGCPLTTPTVLLGFFLPWTWGISSRLLQQSAAASPHLGRGVSPHRRSSWPWTWSSSSRPSCARAAAAPWRWGSSSRAGPLTCGLGWFLSAAAPDLGRVVALLGRRPLPWLPLMRCRSQALSVATADLGQGVAPHGRASARSVICLALNKIYWEVSMTWHQEESDGGWFPRDSSP